MTRQGPLRVLVSSYACGPHWGSEIGMGWGWVTALSAHVQLEVITEAGFRQHVEPALASLDVPHPPRFHYVDIGAAARERIWTQGDWRFYASYARWQRDAWQMARRLLAERPFDLVHQLNMIGYREPGYLWRLPDVPLVWGPVGGHSLFPWRFLPSLDARGMAYDTARNVLNLVQMRLSLRVRAMARRANAIVAATRADGEALRRIHGVAPTVIEETGCHPLPSRPRPARESGDDTLHVAWVGNQQPRKALPLALRAVAAASRQAPVRLDVFGLRDEHAARHRPLVASLGLDDRACRFRGLVPHDQLVAELAAADVLLFPSLVEGTPHVVLEALGVGTPVLCHDLGGHGVAITEACGIKIPARSPADSVAAFARAMVDLQRDPEHRRRLSDGALARAAELTWARKAEMMLEVYHHALSGARHP
jgi:glycosyltransferase involved in cell wall biosynthesis